MTPHRVSTCPERVLESSSAYFKLAVFIFSKTLKEAR
jgi:hypothetical protein